MGRDLSPHSPQGGHTLTLRLRSKATLSVVYTRDDVLDPAPVGNRRSKREEEQIASLKQQHEKGVYVSYGTCLCEK